MSTYFTVILVRQYNPLKHCSRSDKSNFVLHIWILTPVSICFTKFKRISVYFFLYHHLNNYSGRLLIIKFCNYYFVYLFLEMAIYNPWHVDSIQSFWFLRCPECPFDTKEEYIFQDHAIENHPASFSLFGKKMSCEESAIFFENFAYIP